ncbi:unnamed protein product [Hymenolepis diminuta]|uniref:Activator of basal transcription 1 n=1 Tax=Hymenolepis diminuta TaxID=6216 RepID=A0A0R3SPI7_HYMDI|nr:unnamed protein product [Hymenolepis diminuta]VUZ57690.1 unnamed protein product [Hymenolepis diminuta]
MESTELAVVKKEKVPGVLYFSSIPTGMNVAMLTDELSHFGKINRVYLVPKKSKKKKSQRLYSEGWVEFFKKKHAKEAARALNCVEVPGGKRKPWFSELWNVQYLPKVTWGDLFAIEQKDEEQRRIQKDRDIIAAKRQARQFKNSLNSYKLEAKMRASKKKFKERGSLSLNNYQKPTEEEIKERMARSSRTVPEGIEGFSALTNKDFMSNLFSGGL